VSLATLIPTSTDPAAGASGWTDPEILGQHGAVLALSCPSVSLCVATTSSGDVLTSTNPTGGPSAWAERPIGPVRVACPSVSLCVGVGSGDAWTSTDPAAGASTWTSSPIGATVNSISCASVSFCVATEDQAGAGGAGLVLTSTNPTAGAWTQTTVPGLFGAISCPSASLCVAGGDNETIYTSTDPAAGAPTWTTTPVCRPTAPCTSEQLFVHDDQDTRAIDTAQSVTINSIANVTLTGDSLTLNWTHNGAQQQLGLR
jgi:hypothetical protein